ncbi:MAG TPA: CxxC-x17-CxxC domain-containing protein [Candidatus Bipolaricaulota bacterium]|nr:CxxC-x17-CxxC domain-containing protein [Candidatus Bipolaricaulota bacterium]
MEDRQNFGAQRPMVQGNWTCSGCGKEITELPFKPDGDRPIFCKDCHQQRKTNRF